jgi:GTP-binding protein
MATLFFIMKNVKFVKSVFTLSDLPKEDLPEIVLCGRSNVGKSSFINTLFNRKNLAKTSSSPGKTKSLNFYLVEEKFYIVDLPGFGYAKVSKKEREHWQKLIHRYLEQGNNIHSAYHFIDSRHAPMNLDILLNDYLKEFGIPYTVIFSKVDKLKQSELSKNRNELVKIFPELTYGENLISFSAIKGVGKKEVITMLRSLLI